MKKPIVGQVLYSLNIGNAARKCEQKLTPMVVTRVGRKRFYCAPQEYPGQRETAFFLDDWSHDNRGYCQDHQLYETEQDWLDSKERGDLTKFISKSFEYGHNPMGVSLENLRAIRAIIEQAGKAEGRQG